MAIGEWFEMSGYAAYIWSSYGLTVGLFMLLRISTKRLERRTLNRIKQELEI